MVGFKFRQIMRKAIGRFSKNENVSPELINIVVNPDSEYNPVFHYEVNDDPVRESQLLDFQKDILAKKLDRLGITPITIGWLKDWMPKACDTYDIFKEVMTVKITPKSTELKDFNIEIYSNQDKVKTLTIEELFE